MAKRDYYEVLGIERNASADEIKEHSGLLHVNIILIRIPMMKILRPCSKRCRRLMRSSPTPKKKRSMTGMDIMCLVGVRSGLVDSKGLISI